MIKNKILIPKPNRLILKLQRLNENEIKLSRINSVIFQNLSTNSLVDKLRVIYIYIYIYIKDKVKMGRIFSRGDVINR